MGQNKKKKPNRPPEDFEKLLQEWNTAGESENWTQFLSLSEIMEAHPRFSSRLSSRDQKEKFYTNWGNTLFRLGLFEKAGQKFQKVTEINPKNDTAFLNRGTALAKSGQFEEAIQKYQKATQINPNNENTFLNWGNALNDLGRFEEAVIKYQKATQINPNNENALMNWGTVLVKSGQFKKAITKYQKATQIKPNNDKAFMGWGTALNQLGEFKESIPKFQKATQINPNNEDAFVNWGNTLDKLGQFKEAITKYQKAIEINSNVKNALTNWGIALDQLGQSEEAIQKYQKAIEINPKDENAFMNWGNALNQLGQFEEAGQKFQKATEINPENDNAFNNWGNTLFNLDKFEEAGQKFQEAIQINPNDDTAFFLWGASLDRLKNYREADKKLQMAVNLNSGLLYPLFLLIEDRFKESGDYNPRFYFEFSPVSGNEVFHANKKNTQLMRNLFEIEIQLYSILRELQIKEENFFPPVAHYTRKAVLNTLLQEGRVSPFKLVSVQKANDPSEGTILPKVFGYDFSTQKGKKQFGAFTACFTFHPAQLNQFRLYGKEAQEEGTGLSLTFGQSFFLQGEITSKDMIPSEISFSNESSGESGKGQDSRMKTPDRQEKSLQKKLPLLRVIYFDKELKEIVHVAAPNLSRYLKSPSPEKTTSERIEDFYKEEQKRLGEIRTLWEDLKTAVDNFSPESLKETKITKEETDALKTAILLPLRYLVKDAAFQEEEECRLIRIERLSNKEVMPLSEEFPYVLALPYPSKETPVTGFIEKVYLGPRLNEAGSYAEWLEGEHGLSAEQPELPFSG